MFENDFGNFPTKIIEYTEIKKLMLQHVITYVNNHLDKIDLVNGFDVYFVWYSKILKNSKALISTSLPDGMYYELTYNGDKKQWYLDAYKKFDNVCYNLG